MSIEAHGNSQAMHRTGWILSGIVIAFMAADAGSNLLAIAPVKKAALETGYPLDQTWLIGALALICLVLYVIPTHQRDRGDHPNRISRRRDHESPSSGRDANSRDDREPHSWSDRVGRAVVSRSADSRVDPTSAQRCAQRRAGGCESFSQIRTVFQKPVVVENRGVQSMSVLPKDGVIGRQLVDS